MNTNEIKNFYNKTVKEDYQGMYEEKRWFKDPLQKGFYEMTFKFLYDFLNKNNFKINNYLEVGPGPGTWTKIFLNKYPNNNYNLVDISSEMLKICQENLKEFKNILYIESDFLDFSSEKKYDFFFSSRALEYFPDKNIFIKKVVKLLEDNGTALIITKTPKYFRNKILRRKIPNVHMTQIESSRLKGIIKENGFKAIEIYPVVSYFPLLKSPLINKIFFNLFKKIKFNAFIEIFSESYAIKFVK